MSMNIRRMARGERGFTLTEIAIVLGIIGLILGAIWAAASAVYSNMKTSQCEQGITQTAQAVRAMFATSNSTNAAGAAITTPGMFPISWNSTHAGIIGNPWNQNPTVDSSFVYGNGSAFAIEIDGISDSGCATLAAYFNPNASTQNGGSITGLVGAVVGVGGTAPMGAATSMPAAAGAVFSANNFNNGKPTACIGGHLNDQFAVEFDMSVM
jgi:prepilin-type N-terminal cleavage/methylation domain-containing protein